MREINEVELEMVGGGTSCVTVMTDVGKLVGGFGGRTLGKVYGAEVGGALGLVGGTLVGAPEVGVLAGAAVGQKYGGKAGGIAGGYVGKQVGQAIGGRVCGDSWSLPSSSLRGDWAGFDAPDVGGVRGGSKPWAEYMCC